MERLGLGFVNGLCGVSEKKRLRSRVSVSTESSRRGLELSWNYQEKRNEKPLVCDECGGSGFSECKFCLGSGYMRLGDTFLCSTTTCACGACKGHGDVQCKKCCGRGMRAAWL
mmetsp:Transcript_26042/g.102305  ORF Transcript_26042/g.102305 Transcript_26042/m.102305 type:complete len:113 (-) Transcript_26042:237-575(-)